jgi:hypothetical protein
MSNSEPNFKEMYYELMRQHTKVAYLADVYRQEAQTATKMFVVAGTLCKDNNIPYETEKMDKIKAEHKKEIQRIEQNRIVNEMIVLASTDPEGIENITKMMRNLFNGTNEDLFGSGTDESFPNFGFENSAGIGTGKSNPKPVTEEDINNILSQLDEGMG